MAMRSAREPLGRAARLLLCVAAFVAGVHAHASAQTANVPADPDLASPPLHGRALASWRSAFELIRRGAPEYLAALEQIERRGGEQRIALGHVLPSANGRLGFTRELLTTRRSYGTGVVEIEPQNLWSSSASFAVPLIDLAAWRALGTADRMRALAREDFDDVRRTLALRVVDAIFAAVLAQRLAEADRTALRSALERQLLTQQMEQLGRGSSLDVDRTEHDALQARAQLLAQDELLLRRREELGSLLGTASALTPTLALDLAPMAAAIAAVCRPTPELDQRADVVAARRRVELAARAVDSVAFQALPSVLLASRVGWDHSQVYGARGASWDIQALLNVPIWDGGARYGERRALRAEHRAALIELKQVRIRAALSVVQAARSVRLAEATHGLHTSAHAVARRIDERTRAAYSQGRGTGLDLLKAAEALREAERQRWVSELELARSHAAALLSHADCRF